MSILFLVLAFVLMVLWQVPPLLKGKKYKELVSFSVLTLFAFTLALLQILGVKLPDPTKGIVFLVRQITTAKFNYQPF